MNERGLALSLQDIAGEIGIVYNALYRHFESRDDLIMHCLVRSLDLLDASLRASVDAGGPGLDIVLRFVDSFLQESSELETPSGRYVVGLPEDTQRALFEHAAPSHRLLTSVIRSGIDDGSIAETDASITATWVLHALYWYPEEIITSVAKGKRVRATVLELLRRSLAAR